MVGGGGREILGVSILVGGSVERRMVVGRGEVVRSGSRDGLTLGGPLLRERLVLEARLERRVGRWVSHAHAGN